MQEESKIIKEDLGVSTVVLQVHPNQMNYVSTTGSLTCAACIRGGHSMGSNHDIDVYIPQEKTSNTNYGSERLTLFNTMMKGQYYL
jgi:hypothetical protein